MQKSPRKGKNSYHFRGLYSKKSKNIANIDDLPTEAL